MPGLILGVADCQDYSPLRFLMLLTNFPMTGFQFEPNWWTLAVRRGALIRVGGNWRRWAGEAFNVNSSVKQNYIFACSSLYNQGSKLYKADLWSWGCFPCKVCCFSYINILFAPNEGRACNFCYNPVPTQSSFSFILIFIRFVSSGISCRCLSLERSRCERSGTIWWLMQTKKFLLNFRFFSPMKPIFLPLCVLSKVLPLGSCLSTPF